MSKKAQCTIALSNNLADHLKLNYPFQTMGGNSVTSSATSTSITELNLSKLLLPSEQTEVTKESWPYKKDTLFKNDCVNN